MPGRSARDGRVSLREREHLLARQLLVPSRLARRIIGLRPSPDHVALGRRQVRPGLLERSLEQVGLDACDDLAAADVRVACVMPRATGLATLRRTSRCPLGERSNDAGAAPQKCGNPRQWELSTPRLPSGHGRARATTSTV